MSAVRDVPSLSTYQANALRALYADDYFSPIVERADEELSTLQHQIERFSDAMQQTEASLEGAQERKNRLQSLEESYNNYHQAGQTAREITALLRHAFEENERIPHEVAPSEKMRALRISGDTETTFSRIKAIVALQKELLQTRLERAREREEAIISHLRCTAERLDAAQATERACAPDSSYFTSYIPSFLRSSHFATQEEHYRNESRKTSLMECCESSAVPSERCKDYPNLDTAYNAESKRPPLAVEMAKKARDTWTRLRPGIDEARRDLAELQASIRDTEASFAARASCGCGITEREKIAHSDMLHERYDALVNRSALFTRIRDIVDRAKALQQLPDPSEREVELLKKTGPRLHAHFLHQQAVAAHAWDRRLEAIWHEIRVRAEHFDAGIALVREALSAADNRT